MLSLSHISTGRPRFLASTSAYTPANSPSSTSGEYFLNTTCPSAAVKISSASPWRMRWVRLISLGITTRPSSSYCVKQVQKIFVMPQKALKYKRFSAFGTFTNCQFLADPSCYFRDKIRHFLCSCEKVIKLPNNFDCLVVGDKHSINCVVHYLFESFIVH